MSRIPAFNKAFIESIIGPEASKNIIDLPDEGGILVKEALISDLISASKAYEEMKKNFEKQDTLDLIQLMRNTRNV